MAVATPKFFSLPGSAPAKRPRVQFVTPQLSRRAGSTADWGEANIRLSLKAGSGARWAWWSWQRQILDAIDDHSVRQATVMTGSQLGKTQIVDVLWEHHVDTRPEPVFLVYPIEDLLKRAIHDKIEPAIQDCPPLRERVGTGKRKDGRLLAHNAQNIDFRGGGSLVMAYSGSEAKLKNVTARLAIFDEFEEATNPTSAVGHLLDRLTAFGSDGTLVIVSVPGPSGASPTQAQYLAGDQRRFWVPCLDCTQDFSPDDPSSEDGWQLLEWKNVKRERVLGYGWKGTLPCVHCGVVITNAKRRDMIERGRWVAQAEFYGHASFQISRLYNPELSLDDICNAWREGKKELQAFTRGVLGEPYEVAGEIERPEGMWDDIIIAGLPPYEVAVLDANGDVLLDEEGQPEHVPAAPDAVTMGVDVQEDRLEYQVNNWYQGERCFTQVHASIPIPEFDPSTGDDPLEEYSLLADLIREFQPDVTLIDLGYNPVRVKEGIRKHLNWFATRNRVFGCRGAKREDLDTPAVRRRGPAGRDRYWEIATNAAKDTLWDMVGKKLLHVWAGGIPEEYVAMMECEVLAEHERPDGTSEYRWDNPTKGRNEAMDCWVYSYAALRIFEQQGIRRPRNQKIAPDYGRAITAMITAMYGIGAMHGDGEGKPDTVSALTGSPA